MNNEFNPQILFNNKELCLYSLIDKFFRNCKKTDKKEMISIIKGKSEISLRILDWFVTKYSKKHSDFNLNDKNFDVRISYKAQLKSYKKKYFDPFRRRTRFSYKYNEKHAISTTLGQLNFFKWAIECNIINYVKLNLKAIVEEMNVMNKEDKKKIKKTKNISTYKKLNSNEFIIEFQ
jgi:hypothetical protein